MRNNVILSGALVFVSIVAVLLSGALIAVNNARIMAIAEAERARQAEKIAVEANDKIEEQRRRSEALSARLAMFELAANQLAQQQAHEEDNAQVDKMKIETKRADDRVRVFVNVKGTTEIDIQSPTGISHAILTRPGEKWPQPMLLRLHLKGLEAFSISSGKLSLNASVSSTGAGVRQWRDNDEKQTLDATNPFYMPLVAPTADHAYFEITVPQKLLEAGAASITINWIDFYR